MERARIEEPAEKLLIQYGSDILNNPSFLRLKNVTHHANTNVYDHSVRVTLRALNLARDMRIKVHAPSLVRGALLHDYYCYDPHAPGHPWLHLAHHGIRAAKNAMRDFGINEIEADMIVNHMWPIPPFRFPSSNEGWILTLADKLVSVKERFSHKEKTLEDQP